MLSNFFTFRFFIILIRRLSYFIIKIFLDMSFATRITIYLIDLELLLIYIIFFCISYYGAVIVTCCECLYSIFFLVCWSVWVLTSVFFDVMLFECYVTLFEKFSDKSFMTLPFLLISSFKKTFSSSSWFRSLPWFSPCSFFLKFLPKFCSICDRFFKESVFNPSRPNPGRREKGLHKTFWASTRKWENNNFS